MSIVQSLSPKFNAFMGMGNCSALSVSLIVASLAGECWGLQGGSLNNVGAMIVSRIYQQYRWDFGSKESSIFVFMFFANANLFVAVTPKTGEDTSLYRFCSAVDRSSNIFIKVINAIAISIFVEKQFNAPAAVVAGLAVGALSVYNTALSWQHELKI